MRSWANYLSPHVLSGKVGMVMTVPAGSSRGIVHAGAQRTCPLSSMKFGLAVGGGARGQRCPRTARPPTPLPLTRHSASEAAPKSAESAPSSPAAGGGPWTPRCPAGCTPSSPKRHRTAGGSLFRGGGGQRGAGGEGRPLLGAFPCGRLSSVRSCQAAACWVSSRRWPS